MKLLYSVPFSNRSLTFFLPKGLYGAFAIVYRGTNGTTPKNRKDLGNVNLVWNGTSIINVDAELLSLLADLKAGYSTFQSITESILNAMIYIPCGTYEDNKNAYLIDDTTKVYFKLDFPNLANINGNVYIYGIERLGVHNYFYNILSRFVVSGGAGTLSDVQYISNAREMFIKNLSIINSIQIQKDKQLVLDALTPDVLALSDFENQVEASSSLAIINFNKSNDVREIVGNEIIYKYVFNTSGTLEQYFAFITFNNPSKSANVVQSTISKRIVDATQQAKSSLAVD